MDTISVKGKYRFKKFTPFENESDYDDAEKMAARQPFWVGPWIDNLVMVGTNTGTGLIAQALAGVSPSIAEITTASIGTGTTPPTNSDTDIETEVLADIPRASQETTATTSLVGFFIPTADLPNGNYTEFAVFCGANIFARSIITPTFIKSTNEDVGMEYTFTLANS